MADDNERVDPNEVLRDFSVNSSRPYDANARLACLLARRVLELEQEVTEARRLLAHAILSPKLASDYRKFLERDSTHGN